MAYDKAEIEHKALEAIRENELTFFDEICLFVEPTRSTLYNLELDKMDSIKEALAKNKLKKKNKMRKKWEDSDNATLQISAYKLLATDEELEKLTVNNNKNQHSGKIGLGISLIEDESDERDDPITD